MQPPLSAPALKVKFYEIYLKFLKLFDMGSSISENIRKLGPLFDPSAYLPISNFILVNGCFRLAISNFWEKGHSLKNSENLACHQGMENSLP